MDELIDIVDNKGIPTGKSALKSEIHAKGYYHNTAHVWFFTRDRHILLAQRAASKAIYPLLWDVSVAGHVDAGETIETAAIREIKEEINLDISTPELIKIGVFECFQSYSNGIKDNEFHHTYICELKTGLTKLTPQKHEVETLKLVSFNNFESLLENSDSNSHFIASNRGYYLNVLKAMKRQLNPF